MHNQQTSPLSRKQALHCVPVKNPTVVQTMQDEGTLLTYTIEIKPFFHKLAKRITGKDTNLIQKKLQLDHMGSAVWALIDGRRSVMKIAQLFQKKHQLDQREAEISVSSFFKELGKRGIIAMRKE